MVADGVFAHALAEAVRQREITDPTQVIALLSGLFGTIVGVVDTYFGVKSSGDASQRAQELARTMTGTLPETAR